MRTKSIIMMITLPIQGELINEEFKRKSPLLHIHNDEPLSFV